MWRTRPCPQPRGLLRPFGRGGGSFPGLWVSGSQDSAFPTTRPGRLEAVGRSGQTPAAPTPGGPRGPLCAGGLWGWLSPPTLIQDPADLGPTPPLSLPAAKLTKLFRLQPPATAFLLPGPEALAFSSPAPRHPLPLPCQGLPAGSHPPPRAGVRALPINPRRTLPCASALSVCSLVPSLCPDGIPGRAWAARGRVLFCNLPPTPASPTQWLCVGCSGRVRGAQNQPCRKEGFLEEATSYH